MMYSDVTTQLSRAFTANYGFVAAYIDMRICVRNGVLFFNVL